MCPPMTNEGEESVCSWELRRLPWRLIIVGLLVGATIGWEPIWGFCSNRARNRNKPKTTGLQGFQNLPLERFRWSLVAFAATMDCLTLVTGLTQSRARPYSGFWFQCYTNPVFSTYECRMESRRTTCVLANGQLIFVSIWRKPWLNLPFRRPSASCDASEERYAADSHTRTR